MRLKWWRGARHRRRRRSAGEGDDVVADERAIPRAQSLGEEIANAVSHGTGALAAVAAIPVLSTMLYLAMGWFVITAAEPLFTELPTAGLAWLAAGGVAYTLGVVFFVLDERVRYAHFAWHLFVLTGTACHFWAVLGYA